MPYERDPLSVRYDGAAGRLLGRAYAAPGGWHFSAVTSATTDTDDGGRTRDERAFTRALYWNHNGGGNGRRNAKWSLQVDWGPVVGIGEAGEGRLVGVRVSDPAVARRAVGRKPRGDRWYANAGAQSGGIGSPKQRF